MEPENALLVILALLEIIVIKLVYAITEYVIKMDLVNVQLAIGDYIAIKDV